MSAPVQSRIPFAQFRDRVVAISFDVVTSKLQIFEAKCWLVCTRVGRLHVSP